MRMLAQYEHIAFKVVTLYSGVCKHMWLLKAQVSVTHVVIKSAGFRLFGLKLKFL